MVEEIEARRRDEGGNKIQVVITVLELEERLMIGDVDGFNAPLLVLW